MTTTPTIWKAKFTPNFQSGAGEQTFPQSIGLANGNILTVWEDATGGSSPGRDIMGQMFDPFGGNTGPVFQVNYAIVSQDETAPQIAALPDGGYVVAYGSYDSSLGDYIVVQRFDSSGVVVSNGQHFITDDNNGITNGYDGPGYWDVTVDNNGNYIVAFERDGNVKAIVYNYISNNPLPERSVAQNSSDIDHLGNIATFNDGNVITVSNEYDDDFLGVEYMIWQSATGNVVVPPVAVGGAGAGLGAVDATSHSVAVLTGGQFVIVYARLMEDLSRDMAMRIGASDAPGAALSPEIVISEDNSSAKVVALNDGGFLVVWGSANQSDGVLHGTRYTADGTVVGTAGFPIATGVGLAFGYLGDLSLTGDGRVLVTWHGADGEIAEVILDPRENTIYGTDNGEVLTAQIGASRILAFGGDDAIYGSAGDDYLDGGTGADTLKGGGGNDTYVLSDLHRLDPMLNIFVYDSVVESASGGFDTVEISHVTGSSTTNYTLGANVENGVITGSDAFNLTGNSLANELTGNDASNVLTGGDGADTLDGGAGADTMTGGIGNDTYYVDNVGDVVNESTNEGTDVINASIAYTLAGFANIENLTLIGSAHINATGNAGINVLTGNAGNNTLDGGAGSDFMAGSAGNDNYFVDNAADNVFEYPNEGNDTVYSTAHLRLTGNVENLVLQGAADLQGYGNSLSNAIYGNTGSNLLDGDVGADSMYGGLGNDAYYVDNAGDVILENANEGTDTVYSSAHLHLGANLENLLLQGTADLQGFGNALSNAVYGNTGSNLLDGDFGADSMYGGLGNDTYYVDNIADVVVENANEGFDTVYSTASLALAANVDTLLLQGSADLQGYGNGLSNAVYGNSGSNLLDGGIGGDSMYGGVGDDVYYVDNIADVIVENANQGTDTVFSTANLVLGAHVEQLVLQGSADLQGYGNSLSNALYGNSGNNVLDGGVGADALTGNAGNDTFVFHAGEANGDTVIDFAGNGAAAGDSFLFVGYGTAGQGATFTQIGVTNTWQIHSGLDAHNETITLTTSVHASDFLFS